MIQLGGMPRVLHYVTIGLVFAITGSVAAVASRILLNGALGLDGSLWSGPWSYRAVYLLLIPPSYSVTLIAVGALFGKREYFARRVRRTWGRLLPIRRAGAAPRPDPAERRRGR